MKKISYNFLTIKSEWNRNNFRLLAYYFLLSLGVNSVVELCNRRSFSAFFSFVCAKPLQFLYGALIIFFTVGVSLLFRKRNYVLLLVSATWMGLALTSFIMLSGFRSTPLTAPDIAILRVVGDIVQIYLSDFAIILILIGMVFLLGLLVYLFFKFKTHKAPYVFALLNLGLIAAVVFGCGSLLKSTGYLDTQFPNIPDAYQNNGFAYCFSCSALYQGIDEPDGYSEERIMELLSQNNDAVPPSDSKDPNIVFVQLESFFDLSYLNDMEFSADPTPNFTRLKQNFSSGLFSVPSIGAGTVNTEFEVLSQMNLQHFGMGEYPYKTVVRYRVCESIAYMLKQRGFFTHALHNNNATFYSRNRVYRHFGFDTFTSIEYMNNIEMNPLGWAKDACLTDEILRVLDSTEERDFIFAVSVQPHGQYPTEPLDESQKICITSEMENAGRKCEFEYYANQLHDTDAFVGDLVRALRNYKEDVVVVFYGDHLPGLGIMPEELSYGDVQTTEYVIWANFRLPVEDKDIYAYQLASTVLEKISITDGILTKHHLAHQDLPTNDYLYEDGLRLLEYDMLYGEHYCYDGETPYSATDLQLGTASITVASATFDEGSGSMHVFGNNFTPYSVVEIDAEQYETEFVSPTELVALEVRATSGDKVCVVQISMTDPLKILSQSNEIVYQN